MRFAFFLLAFLAFRVPATPETDGPRRPVIVELFTSEGCSSCPPADALLQKLDQSQPVPGALVIAMSEHVDYWDSLGWKDPFSSALYTRRQEAYVRRLHLESAYTPQIVIDGVTDALGSDARQVQDGIRQAVKSDKLQVQILPVFKNSRGAATVHIQIDAPAKGHGETRVMLALAENAVVSHVLRGENSGRKLDHVAVVRSLTDVGRLDLEKGFSADIPLTGEWSGKRLIAFLQDGQFGRIQGASMRLLN
jgi:hypothetical protein